MGVFWNDRIFGLGIQGSFREFPREFHKEGISLGRMIESMGIFREFPREFHKEGISLGRMIESMGIWMELKESMWE